MRNHLTATIETPEEKKRRLKEEREARLARAKRIKDTKDKDKKDDDNIFKKYEPKEDYQVLQAVNYLRTFQVYKRFESAKVEVKK